MDSGPPLIQTIRQFLDLAMHNSMRERAHFARATGLSMPQFGILMQLYYRHDCGVSHISERFDISSAAASQLVEKLVQGGLIRREEDPGDRRARILNLTEKGRELIHKGMEQRYRWADRLAAQLDPDQRARISEALVILTDVARELETETAGHAQP